MANPRLKRVFQLFWDSEPSHTDFENEIVCLGIKYDPIALSPTTSDNTGSNNSGHAQDSSPHHWPAKFLSDVESRIWLTYRTNFAVIPKAKDGPSPISFLGGVLKSGIDLSGFTSDVGWGCMIRTGQCLLANSLLTVRLGRDYRVKDNMADVDIAEKKIICLFADSPEAPYSVQRFVAHGEAKCGKLPGEWFGPSAAASSIQALLKQTNSELGVYISHGSDLYESEFLRVARPRDEFKPTLILLGLRLGIDNVNELYWDSLKQFLSCNQAVGIAGGRPSSSHYFYAYQGDYLFYLDPHFPRPALTAVDPKDLTKEDYQSVHSTRIRKLHLKEMDPSMLVGILIKDEKDWEDWQASVKSNKAVHISESPPIIMRRSSLSTGSDDEEGFVDVVFDPNGTGQGVEEEPDVADDGLDDLDSALDKVNDDYDSCHVENSTEIMVDSDENIFLMEQDSTSQLVISTLPPEDSSTEQLQSYQEIPSPESSSPVAVPSKNGSKQYQDITMGSIPESYQEVTLGGAPESFQVVSAGLNELRGGFPESYQEINKYGLITSVPAPRKKSEAPEDWELMK